MGELGEFLCFSVNESGSFYIDDGASMHFSKAAHIWFGYRPLADLFWGSGGPFRNQSNTLKVSFSVSNSDAEGLKKCGVRLVYEQDEKYGEWIFPFGTLWPGEGDESGDHLFNRPRFPVLPI